MSAAEQNVEVEADKKKEQKKTKAVKAKGAQVSLCSLLLLAATDIGGSSHSVWLGFLLFLSPLSSSCLD
jgi:hypothetical protein